MAKLKLTPLLAIVPPIMSGMIDRATTVRWDPTMESVHVRIANGEATIDALWASSSHRWLTIEATIHANASSTTAARLNRLLTGTGAARAETYHRTGSIVIRAPHRAYSLPATIDLRLTSQGSYIATYAPYGNAAAPPPAPIPAPQAQPTPVQTAVGAIVQPCTVHGLMHAEARCPRHNLAEEIEKAMTSGGTIGPVQGWPVQSPTLPLPSAGSIVAAPSPLSTFFSRPNPAQATVPSVMGPDPAIIPEPDCDELGCSSPRTPGSIYCDDHNGLTEPTPDPEPQPVKVAPQVQRDPAGLMTFPTRNATERIEMASEERDMLEIYWRKHTSGEQSIVSIVGPSGTGKTSLIWDLAAEKQVGLFMFDAAGASSFTDWTGTTVLRQGEGSPVTEFITSAFIEFARIDGPCGGKHRIGGVDELNRAESGGALNALLPILAQGQLFIPELGQTIIFDPAVFWMFTMNRGSAYNATLSLDAALADRVQTWVKLDMLSEKQEVKLLTDRTGITTEQADKLVKTAKQVREIADRGELTHSISTRRTLDAARAVKHGATLRQAAIFCWANSYLDEGGKESDRGRVESAIEASLGQAVTTDTPW